MREAQHSSGRQLLLGSATSWPFPAPPFCVLLRQRFRRHDVGGRGLQLVLPAADHVAFALHHRLEAVLGDVGRIVLLVRPDLGIQHVGALEEFGLGRARHQAGHRDAGVLELFPQREGEGVEERLGAVVDGLIGARHEAGDRAGDQDAAIALCAHVAADLVDQIDRAGDVGVDHVAGCRRNPDRGRPLPRPRPALASSASTGRPLILP